MSLSFLRKILQDHSKITKEPFEEALIELDSSSATEYQDFLSEPSVHNKLLTCLLSYEDRYSRWDNKTLAVILELLSHASEDVIEEEMRLLIATADIKDFDFNSLINRLLQSKPHSIVWREFIAAADLYFRHQNTPAPVIIQDYFFYEDIKNSFSSVIPEEYFHVQVDVGTWRKNLCKWFSQALLNTPWPDPQKMMALLSRLTLAEQQGILMQKDKDGWNALMAAARYHPEAVAPLLEHIKQLEQDKQQAILMQKDKDGRNVLMLAACYHPKAAVQLLEYIEKLPPEEQKPILTPLLIQKIKGWNALMAAAHDQSEAVAPLLERINKLPLAEQQAILTQKSQGGWDALMLAARYQPKAIAPLLEHIEKLPLEEKQAILTQKKKDGWNALMEAACYHPEAIAPLLEHIKQLPTDTQKAILTQKNEDGRNALMLAATSRAHLHVRFLQMQTLAGRDAYSTRSAYAAERLYEGVELLFKDERAWPQWPALREEARTAFKYNAEMLQLIEALDKELTQHQRLTRNKRQYKEFASYFNLEPKTLSMDEQYLYLNPVTKAEKPPLAECFLKVRDSLSKRTLSEHEAKEKVAMVYALIKTFSLKQVREILNSSMAVLSAGEQNQLQEWLEAFDEEIIARQMDALRDEKNELVPSAPPIEVLALADEPLPMAQATKTAETDKPVLTDATLINETVHVVEAMADDQWLEEALAENNLLPPEWETQLLRAPQATIKELAALPHEKQQAVITYLEKKPASLRQLMRVFQTDPISQRYFLLVQLGTAPTKSANARDYLYNQLKTLIDIEERTSAPEKRLQINQLWQDFIERCRMSVEKEGALPTRFANGFWSAINKPANVLDELLKIQQHPQFKPQIPQETPVVHASAPAAARPMAMSSAKGEKALFLALQKNNNTAEVEDLLAENYPQHLEYQDGAHNILTLMFSKRHPALYDVMLSIKNLPDDKRQHILSFVTNKQHTLIEPRAYVNQRGNYSVMGKQALYVLELERIVLSMKNNDPAKQKLQQLHTTLAAMDSIEGHTLRQKQWFEAIQKTRKMPEVKQKRGIVNWFKSALGFAKTENIKGYGIGFFKPSVDSLLDDMTNLPKEEQYFRQKK